MDLTQRRLNRDEWEAIETPVSDEERRIGKLLLEGAHNPSVRRNRAVSLCTFLQITPSDGASAYFWEQYLLPELSTTATGKKTGAPVRGGFPIEKGTGRTPVLKAADKIRLRNAPKALAFPGRRQMVFEFVLVDLIRDVYEKRAVPGSEAWHKPYYALRTIRNRTVPGVHAILRRCVDRMVELLDAEVPVASIVANAGDIIERNPALYEHQAKVLDACRPGADVPPRLILFTAPTGTGKTVSPAGVSVLKRVVFVCAARHVGIALAKLSVSLGKKVGFAFGCEAASDIRLHFHASTECLRDKRSGRILRVDNAAGEDVEIMICDVKSCALASDYMLSFNKAESLVLYWDEPTISLDYPDHPCHAVVKDAWQSNRIPTVVLSSATLPRPEELEATISAFKAQFEGAEIVPIQSHECRKSIPLLNEAGSLVMPHDLGESDEGASAAAACAYARHNQTLLRHIDLTEACRFIREAGTSLGDICPSASDRFPSLDAVYSLGVKQHYLDCVIAVVEAGAYGEVMGALGERPLGPGARVMTTDAKSLTDGPTIFLADDVDKIARVCIKQAALPADVLKRLGKDIAFNTSIRDKLSTMQMEYENLTMQDEAKGHDKRLGGDKANPAARRIAANMDALRALTRPATAPRECVPNTPEHQKRYAGCASGAPFCSEITEETVEAAMLLSGVDDKWKLLLLLGVGVFAPWNSPSYTELMKSLAQQQKLFMVVATSDYIYGTNYQFCHGYIAKDLAGMSQEKCIQAMGRVGRNRLQQSYSIRFREPALIARLFREEANRPEAQNMAKLFC